MTTAAHNRENERDVQRASTTDALAGDAARNEVGPQPGTPTTDVIHHPRLVEDARRFRLPRTPWPASSDRSGRRSANLSTRIVILLFVAFGLGCAGLARPPERYYRVSGVASTPTPDAREEARYLLQLGGGVEYTIQAAVTFGEVRLRTVVRNGGSEPVRYDLQRTVIAAADGGPLRLVDTDEEPSLRPTDAERASEDYVRGVRAIAPGQRNAIARRYVLANGLRRGRDVQLLARLSVGDVIGVGDRETWVKLRLDEMR